MTGGYPEEVKDGFVRIQVTDSYVGLEALSGLRRVYPNLLEVSGRTYEGEDSSVTLTMEELDRLSDRPIDVFKYFCQEETGADPDEHLVSLFEEAVRSVEGADR